MMQGIKVTEWDAFLELGRGKPTEPVPPKPDDPATIMYTSGTTGGDQMLHLLPSHCRSMAQQSKGTCSSSLHVPSTETCGVAQAPLWAS